MNKMDFGGDFGGDFVVKKSFDSKKDGIFEPKRQLKKILKFYIAILRIIIIIIK
jgi:hypothetical protein